MSEERGKAKAVARWREQGLDDVQIAEKLANWGTPGKPYSNLVRPDSTNPYMGMPLDRLRAIQLDLRKEANAIRLRSARLNQALEMVNRALVAVEPPEVMVSDHAILRYAERKLGLNIEEIREELRAMASNCPGENGSRFIDTGEVKLVVAQSVIQTVVDADGRIEKGPDLELPMVVTVLSPEMTTDDMREAQSMFRLNEIDE